MSQRGEGAFAPYVTDVPVHNATDVADDLTSNTIGNDGIANFEGVANTDAVGGVAGDGLANIDNDTAEDIELHNSAIRSSSGSFHIGGMSSPTVANGQETSIIGHMLMWCDIQRPHQSLPVMKRKAAENRDMLPIMVQPCHEFSSGSPRGTARLRTCVFLQRFTEVLNNAGHHVCCRT